VKSLFNSKFKIQHSKFSVLSQTKHTPTKHKMKYRYLFVLAATVTGTAFGGLSAPLPEFKTAKQLAVWRAEKAAEAATKSTTDEHAFYTGKPYVESSGGYAFKFRSYNPELVRWTSEDPSGFPDGANSYFYSPTPTIELDFQGLNKTVVLQENYYDDISNYFSHDQMRITVGMDPTLVLNIRSAAYQEFKNNIAQSYSVGDQITKGPLQSVLTGIVSDSATLRTGYPKSSITAISYSDSTGILDFGFTFHAFITSNTKYSYYE
jgi:RHS repeat-associated protein